MKISVITAAYNSAATIAHTIESVLAQTHRDIEYIVADGLSSDSTMDIVDSYAARFGGRLVRISGKDGGIYHAMNKGLAAATGDVVGFLNSDDFFTSPDILSEVARNMAAPGVDAVYGDVHFVREGDLGRCVRYYSSARFRPWALRFGFMPAHPSLYAKRSLYARVGGYDTSYKLAADYEMAVRMFVKAGAKGRYIPRDFVTMRTGGASTRGAAARLTLLREDVRACRSNGVYTNALMVATKYTWKIFEFVGNGKKTKH